MPKNIVNIEAAMSGALTAMKENSPATDGIIIVCDKMTGEFKMGSFPPDPTRNIALMEKALFSLKRAAGREYRAKGGIIIPTKTSH